MQLAPSEMLKLSLWEFSAMVQGWNKANAPADASKEIQPDDEEALSKFIDEKPIWMN
jgi:hypothetical protein